jgi:hypothetical protein
MAGTMKNACCPASLVICSSMPGAWAAETHGGRTPSRRSRRTLNPCSRLQKISGECFEDCVQKNIFNPLQMSGASYSYTPEVQQWLAKLYRPDGVTPYPARWLVAQRWVEWVGARHGQLSAVLSATRQSRRCASVVHRVHRAHEEGRDFAFRKTGPHG